jgi:hypothetical protein
MTNLQEAANAEQLRWRQRLLLGVPIAATGLVATAITALFTVPQWLAMQSSSARVRQLEALEQQVPLLREQLLKDGQILEYAGPKSGRGVDPKSVEGIVVDDKEATLSGSWVGSTSASAFLGDGYRHDGDARDGRSIARFESKLPEAGRYRVFLAAPPNDNRATRVPVEIHHAGGVTTVKLDLRSPKPAKGVHWFELGEF